MTTHRFDKETAGDRVLFKNSDIITLRFVGRSSASRRGETGDQCPWIVSAGRVPGRSIGYRDPDDCVHHGNVPYIRAKRDGASVRRSVPVSIGIRFLPI